MEAEKRPIIGILSLPGDGTLDSRVCKASDVSYVPASLVKMVEGGGARVMVIRFNEPQKSFEEKLNMVNAIIFPGGRPHEGEFLDAVKKFFSKNEDGMVFPLIGICLGFQMLVQVVSENDSFFPKKNEYDALKHPAPLKIWDRHAKPFSEFHPVLLQAMGLSALPYHNNRRGVSVKKFQENEKLNLFFDILSTSADKSNEVFVSTIKSKLYPIYGVQWHPEKYCFEWELGKYVPHSAEATRITQAFSNFIVEEARLSADIPESQDLRSKLIYNYPKAFSGLNGKGFDEVYYFTSEGWLTWKKATIGFIPLVLIGVLIWRNKSAA